MIRGLSFSFNDLHIKPPNQGFVDFRSFYFFKTQMSSTPSYYSDIHLLFQIFVDVYVLIS
ncbi:hypothetical protein HanXRQr2_Chr07g0310771 [Helianthus annuus]|uniref:Uncharacterized protein n=1 Tax=Helianthus annuus TaxID=4232 RepID=A0A251UDN5_HELAN|nr:hypothetical protein HanXRQr2_Chr07g0310771 [Helianthus annuus]